MAEGIDQVTTTLSDTSPAIEVQDVRSKLEQLQSSNSVKVSGDVKQSVITVGDNNSTQFVINQGTDIRELLKWLDERITEAEKAHQRPIRCKMQTLLITSVGIGVFIGIVRFFVGLSSLELPALDGLMAAQAPFAQEDNRILVIAPNDEEVQQQGQEVYEKGVSFTDDKLAEVLEKIRTFHPLVIGLDLQRPFKAKGKLAQLLSPNSTTQQISSAVVQYPKISTRNVSTKKVVTKKVISKQNQPAQRKKITPLLTANVSTKPEILNLVGGCKALETKEGNDGRPVPIEGTEIPPPPEISAAQIGFVDFVIGIGSREIFRRQILAQEIPPNAEKCKTTLSFSTRIANQFLSRERGYTKVNANPENKQCPHFLHSDSKRNFTFPYFETFTGGYQGGAEESDWYGGCKIILNYGKKKVNKIELTALLNKDKNKNALDQLNPKPKIVVIGSAARSRHDMWLTPVGEKEGAMIQALTVSQIIDTVLGEQRLIWVMPQWADFLWILGWSVLGGFVGWHLRFWKPWLLSLTAAVIVLYLGCGLSFWLSQLWLPLIPSLLTLLASASSVAYLNFRLKFGTNNPFQILRKALVESK
ncbi:MAG: CHASE2 domain-containing protein [Lyngbya sp. HA4199-MV5]|jgi:CHASE2 domain-containing sensor protein|nr:CHASE2 domain-containing protein [Lyngbya sp. HA4199-MV5]